MKKYLNCLNLLSWNESLEVQNKAIEYLSEVRDWDFKGCITKTQKDVWGNMVKVIMKNKNIDKRTILQDLIFLLKDLTWPGALEALNIIKEMKKEEVISDLKKALVEATNEKDEMWIDNLKLLLTHFNFL